MAARNRKSDKRLSEAHKIFLTQQLAMFYTPQEAAKSLNDEYGIEISPQAAQHYDPSKRQGRTLSKHLCDLFKNARKQFLEQVDSVPHSHKAVRIRKLAKAADTFESRGNLIAMSEMLVLIAKEKGGCFTNQRQISGPGGKPIEHKDATDYDAMNEVQLRRELQMLFFGRFGHLMAEEEPAGSPADG